MNGYAGFLNANKVAVTHFYFERTRLESWILLVTSSFL